MILAQFTSTWCGLPVLVAREGDCAGSRERVRHLDGQRCAHRQPVRFLALGEIAYAPAGRFREGCDRGRGARDVRGSAVSIDLVGVHGPIRPWAPCTITRSTYGSLSRISGLTRRSGNPANRPPGRDGSPSAGRRPRGGRWSSRPGAWSSSPDRCARSTNASVLAAGTAGRSSRRPASSRSCSGACSNAARTTRTSDRR
jgi:hypothetical protein